MDQGTKCRSCGKPVKFIETTSGKRIPVSLETEETRVWIEDRKARVGKTWLAHFVDCPEASRWRRKK